MRKYRWLSLCLGAILVLYITMAWYLYVPGTPGPWPFTIVSGAVAAVHCLCLILSGVDLWRYKFHWQALVTILLSIPVMILNGYTFAVGLIISITW